jgi:hypothetical protein
MVQRFRRRMGAGHLAARRAGAEIAQPPNPYLGVIGQVGKQAREIGGAMEAQFPSQQGPFSQFAQQALPQLAAGGFSPAEDIAARRGITNRVRSLIGGAATQGARGGFYSPERTARTGQQAATTALAPALVQHEANVARARREGLGRAAGLAAGLAPGEQRAEAQRRASYGGLLGRMLRRRTGIPTGSQIMGGMFA